MGYRLGVDLGTTYTAAAVSVDGRAEMLGLGIRAMQVPSVVFVRDDGEIVVGEAAEQQGAADPARVVREFKRRIGDSVPLVVGGAPYSAQALTARLLAWVVRHATERQGGPPGHVCVTHPANWGPFKRDLLGQAIELAGLRGVETSTRTEPEAAAIAYAARDRVAEGDRVAVYDLGGGTFDAAVLVREGAGFRLAGPPEGVEHLGGIDFDEAVFRHVLAAMGDDAAGLDDSDPATVTALARLRRDCVEAKEVLSFSVDTVVAVALPGVTRSVRLTRGELEDMLRPAIGETVSATRRVLASAGVQPADVSAMLLVGGSSRIPLVSEMLSAAFGRPLALDNHPKHDVALGAAIRGTPAAPPLGAPSHAQPRQGQPPQVQPPQGQPDGRAAGRPPGGRAVVAGAAGAAGWVPGAAALPAQPPVRTAAASAASGSALPGAGPHPGTAVPPGSSHATAPTWPGPDGSPPYPGTAAPPGSPHATAPNWAGSGGPVPAAAPSTDWRPPAIVGPAPTRTAPPSGPRAPGARASGRRALALGCAVVVALAVTGGILLLRNRAEPAPAPIAIPTTVSAPPTATVASLPRSAQPLGNDVIVWPRLVGDNWDIATVTAGGVVGPNLTDGPDEDNLPVISADRRTIAYLHRTSAGTHEVWVMGADGTGRRPLFATVPPGCADVTRPAFGDRPVLQVVLPCVDPATGETTLNAVTLDGTVYKVVDRGVLSDPALTPDGRFVIYWKADGPGQDGGTLYRAPLNGPDIPVNITAGGDDRDNDADVSPNGDLVAFTRAGQGIWTVGLGGENLAARLTTQDGDMDPSWSPDGSRITFKRQNQMWVMDADGGNARRITEPGDLGTAAAWSPR